MTTTAFTTLALSYADKSVTADNAAAKLTAHADWAPLVARYDSKARGSANELAREALGFDANEPIKTGPTGAQKVTPKGRRIETLARLIKTHAEKSKPATSEHVTVTYVDAEGKSHTRKVATDFELFAGLRKLALNES